MGAGGEYMALRFCAALVLSSTRGKLPHYTRPSASVDAHYPSGSCYPFFPDSFVTPREAERARGKVLLNKDCNYLSTASIC